MKTLDDKENIEQEINRMILEYKSKQQQTLFVVWARKLLTNQYCEDYVIKGSLQLYTTILFEP